MIIFKTERSDLKRFNGKKINAMVPLPDDEYDKSKVGEMFRVRLEDGTLFNAVYDEIIEVSLMEMLQDAGYPTEKMYHWQSDLQIFATKETSEVIDRWCEITGYSRHLFVKTFRDNITGRTMFDIAFQYDPFWDKLGEEADK